MEHVVVSGAGLSGSRSVEELRRQGFTGRVTLLGAESHPPYDRPPLSKAMLTADDRPDISFQHDLGDVELLLGRRATGLRPGVLETDHGDLECDGLIVATGSDPVRLPGDGPQHALRTVDDARALRAALVPKARVVVVGASWIGAEVAGAALSHGCTVTCIEAGPAPLHLALGAETGARTVEWWDGIDLRLGTGVGSIDDGGITLADGTWVDADVVLVGVGVRPAVGWLEGSGVTLDRGVLVDEHLLAELPADHPWSGRLAVVGDASAWPSTRYGVRMRVEHWDDALSGPTTAVAALLGDATAVHDPVPYFWSDQLGHKLQYVGHHGSEDTLVRRDSDGFWGVGWVRPDGRLGAYLAVDKPRDMIQARKLIEAGTVVDPERLADPDTAIKDLV
jgi:3-phenylpropionate/trans-cinnamate dioxygenase ferredoxin reductase subunit